MSNLLPGLGALGYGFDVDGNYRATSTRLQLFDLNQGNETEYTYLYPNGTKITYRYPSGLAVSQINDFNGSSLIFAGRSEYSQHFEAEAGMNLSAGTKLIGFSGEFDLSYAHSEKSDSSYWFGLFEDKAWFWQVKLPSPNPSQVLASVQQDPVYMAVPERFDPSDPENTRAFYRFFAKYGTYFTRGVTVGGRLYYNVTVTRSAFSSTTEMQGQLSAEFKAYFVKTGAEAKAEWQNVSSQWMSNRQVHITAMGGTPEILMSLSQPRKGENASDIYKGWLDSLPAHPAEVAFQLEPVSLAFSGDRERAVNEAIAAYLLDSVYVESRYETSAVQVQGRLRPPEDGGPRAGHSGCRVVVTDSQLEVVLNKTYQYSWQDIGSEYRRMYEKVLADLEPYDSSDHVVALGLFGMAAYYFPVFGLYEYLVSLGAGSDLLTWDGLSKGGYETANRQLNYVIIGVPGSPSGAAFEQLETSEKLMASPGFTPGKGDPGSWERYEETPADAASRMARVHRDLSLTAGEERVRMVLGLAGSAGDSK